MLAKQLAVGRPLVEIARAFEAAGVGAVYVARVRVDVDAIGLHHVHEVGLHRARQRLLKAALAARRHHRPRLYGELRELVLSCEIRECGADDEELAVEGRRIVGGGIVEDDEAGLASQRPLAVEDKAAGRRLVVVAGRIEAEVPAALRHLAIQVGDARVDVLLQGHRGGVDDAHRRLEVVVAFLLRIPAGVGHEETALVERDALGLVAHLAGGNHLEAAQVYLRHETSVEVRRAVDGLALVAVARHIDVLAVGAKAAVVGDVLCGGHCDAVGTDELNDVRPVDGNGDEVRVDLYDVVRRVAKLVAIPVAKPLVADDGAVLEVAEPTVISLPHALVQEDDPLLRARVIY